MDQTDMSDPVDRVIHYLNADLDLESDDDLTEVASALKSRGLLALHVTKGDNGRWYATFEADEQADEPQPNIEVMVDALESLSEDLQSVWSMCSLREVNIGYECGDRPWASNQGLSNVLLRRIAVLGVCLRVTIYPMTKPDEGNRTA